MVKRICVKDACYAYTYLIHLCHHHWIVGFTLSVTGMIDNPLRLPGKGQDVRLKAASYRTRLTGSEGHTEI